MDKDHEYGNGEVTIIWRKHLCVHSTRCWKGLPRVFKPGERPWIDPAGANTGAIIAQVAKCPSGALSIRKDGPATPATREDAMVRVEVTANGPLIVKGTVTVQHPDGRTEVKEGKCALCRCGASANKPYCDGSHRSIAFS